MITDGTQLRSQLVGGNIAGMRKGGQHGGSFDRMVVTDADFTFFVAAAVQIQWGGEANQLFVPYYFQR